MLAAEEPEPVKEESTAEASSAPKRRKKTKSEVKETKSEVKECDDSQLSLATLLKGQEQMIAQSIWNNAKDMIESQESQSKSELMSALGGSASEVFTEKLAEEFLKFLKIKANPDEVEHDLEKPGDTVMDSSGGLSTEALRALEEQETVPGDITEVAAAPAEPTAPATKAPEVVPPVAPEALALPSVPAAAPETKAPEVAPLAPVAPEALALPSTAPAAAPETKAPEVAPLALPSTAPAAPSTAPAAAVPNLLRTPPHIRLGSTVAHVSLGQQRQMLTAEDLKGMDEGNDLKKEYLAATCALELPKGNDLRVKLTTLKVEIGQIWDDTKVIDADLIDETTFEKHMAKIADVLTRSKMLRVQARAAKKDKTDK
eukprot:g21175.t1